MPFKAKPKGLRALIDNHNLISLYIGNVDVIKNYPCSKKDILFFSTITYFDHVIKGNFNKQIDKEQLIQLIIDSPTFDKN